jgi:hypothetical protein
MRLVPLSRWGKCGLDSWTIPPDGWLEFVVNYQMIMRRDDGFTGTNHPVPHIVLLAVRLAAVATEGNGDGGWAGDGGQDEMVREGMGMTA